MKAFKDEVLVGTSPEARRINRAVRAFAEVDKNVLLVGDTGTGKDFTARRIHDLSSRSGRAFVALNCAAVGQTIFEKELFGEELESNGAIRRVLGLLERANHGTLYLDHVTATPTKFQFQLLQIVRERMFRRDGGQDNILLDVRFISSCPPSVESMVEQREFSKDLYYLLKPLSISIPPLKARKQDIPEFLLHFLKQYCVENELDVPAVPAEIFESILEYEWGGNIAELKNCVENLVMMSHNGELSSEYLPFEVKRHPLDNLEVENLTGVISEVETHLIKKALGKYAGNQVKAARLLGIPEATLRFKIKKYAIPKR